jgi:uncharacterized HAD superfamily protein
LLKIALDVDGVLADIHTAVFRYLGMPYTYEDVKRWDFFNDFEGLNAEIFWDTYRKLWSQRWDLIRLVDIDCVEVLRDLSKRHRIDVVTCRDRDLVRGTCIWLALKRIPYEDFVLLPPGGDKTRLDKYDLFIDDNPAMAKDRKRLILFDRPWNRGVRSVRRIRRFRELYEYLEGRKSG